MTIEQLSQFQAEQSGMRDIPQNILLKKTPLDIALERIEDKYGSITKAPEKAVKFVQNVVRGMGMSVSHQRSHKNRFIYQPIRAKRIATKHHNHPVPKNFKFWISSAGNAFTNYPNLVNASRRISDGYSTRAACYLSKFPYWLFIRLHLKHSGYVYRYNRVNQHVPTLKKLFKYCKALNWSFGPCNYHQYSDHRYQGKVTTYIYYKPVYYKKLK